MSNGVLVDTSVWVAHFKSRNAPLIELLMQDMVFTHPMIIGELACGTPPKRHQTLQDIEKLKHTKQASLGEIMHLIEQERLYGLGCGFIDLTLLTSTLMTNGVKLWTLDKRLRELSARFNILYQANQH